MTMASEKRDNSGTLGKNDRKEKEEHPSHTGSAMIDGREYWISAWVKESARGKFFSLAFKPKDKTATKSDEYLRQAARNAPPARTYAEELDDEIPF